MKMRVIPILLFIFVGGLGNAVAQALDISSGGTPTITGALNGSVSGSSSVLNNLSVTINFGEVSPANTNNIVKVVIPIGIRSNQPYKVDVSFSGLSNINLQAIQPTDIGFGVNNFHALGAQSRVCNNSSHIFYSPFNNDPAANVSIGSSGRVAYLSSLKSLITPATVLSGPRLTNNNNGTRQSNDGYIFDAIFAITPQFFAAGTTSTTVTFTISAGPNVPC